LAAARTAGAQGRRLNVFGHRVHQLSLTTGPAGDLTTAWRGANGAEVAWSTFDTNPLQDRLFREASLGSTDLDVGFLVNSRATPNVATLLQSLNAHQAQRPIEEFGDIAPGLVQAMTINGQMIGVPLRHATQGLFYNEAILQERGITAPPRTMEELVDQAKRATHRTSDGRQVVGMVLASDLTVFPVAFARAFGGDFIGPDFRVIPNPDAMAKALDTMRDMYQTGALPRTYATTTNEDQVTWMQQGLAAFSMLPFARFQQVNRPDQSRFPGRIKAVEFPVSATLTDRSQSASVTEFWAMSIPANARDKDLSWSFIQAMSSKAVTLGAARNGNGPVRVSTYREASFTADQPLAAVESQALARARVPLPAFPEAARAQSIFIEEVQRCVLGMKSTSEAIASIVSRVGPLVPRQS
jgi:multiple sugar transport system substrate-binding protein